MSVLYSVSGHAKLAPKTALLDTTANREKFLAEQRLAESLLRQYAALPQEPTSLTEDEVEDVRLGIVVQMNFQVEQGIDPLVASRVSSSHTKQAVEYRDRIVNPQAIALVSGVSVRYATGNSWRTLTSVRTQDRERWPVARREYGVQP